MLFELNIFLLRLNTEVLKSKTVAESKAIPIFYEKAGELILNRPKQHIYMQKSYDTLKPLMQ